MLYPMTRLSRQRWDVPQTAEKVTVADIARRFLEDCTSVASAERILRVNHLTRLPDT